VEDWERVLRINLIKKMNPITRKSISELVSFRSLIGFGEAATERQTFKNCKIYKEM